MRRFLFAIAISEQPNQEIFWKDCFATISKNLLVWFWAQSAVG